VWGIKDAFFVFYWFGGAVRLPFFLYLYSRLKKKDYSFWNGRCGNLPFFYLCISIYILNVLTKAHLKTSELLLFIVKPTLRTECQFGKKRPKKAKY
jgi:hypothetical protein